MKIEKKTVTTRKIKTTGRPQKTTKKQKKKEHHEMHNNIKTTARHWKRLCSLREVQDDVGMSSLKSSQSRN